MMSEYRAVRQIAKVSFRPPSKATQNKVWKSVGYGT